MENKKNTIAVINNEEGSTIVLAMLMLAVLTILGISSINTSTMELQIVHNEKIYQRNFYQAEAAVLEAAQRLSSESNIDEIRPSRTTKFTSWLRSSDINLDTLSIFTANDAASLLSNNATFAANATGIVSGGSLGMTKDSNIYGFKIYGYSIDNDGNVLITIGFKTRI